MNVEKIRKDFPVLDKKIVYVDSACMTLRPNQVIEAMNKYYYEFPACGGRSYHKLGVKVGQEVDKARKIVAKFFGAKTKEIIFTKNATESLNLVANTLDLKEGDMVLSTDKEHNSNLIPWLKLKEKGIEHKVVYSNDDNTFNIEEFKEKVKGVKLVSMVYTSNLDGTTIPAKEIIEIAHQEGALVLLDCAQAAAHKQIDVKKIDVDFIAGSSHKMLGPSGVGFLYGKYELLENLSQFILGGDTVKDSTYQSFEPEDLPKRLEAGLQNYPGIIGFGAAVSYLDKIGMKNIEKHDLELNKYLTEKLLEFEEIELIGPKDPVLRSSIFSFNIKGKDSHEVAIMLDSMSDVMVRSGAHCVHSWFNKHDMSGSVRISLYIYNTIEDCDKIVDSVKKIIGL